MLQHLLNTTAIWLLFLLAFDLLLRRETFHSYNRMYLLFSFILGLVLPLWIWDADSAVYTTAFERPLNTIVETKQGINVVADTSGTYGWQQYLSTIYWVGFALAALLLIADLVKVVLLYLRGRKSKEQGWVLIETGKEHGPFSLFRLLFVNNKAAYEAGQWQMILRHEQHHRNRLHFVDLLFLQLAAVIFWFHPLVYSYRKRLMLVHEYEADSAIDTPVKDYGQFLLEQSLLASAPAITHSFNRSSIKNRILMLTRTSGAFARARQLALLPLVVISAILFTQKGYSQERKKEGNVITYKGNKIEMGADSPPDTIMVEDPTTGEISYKVVKMVGGPAKLNGEKIYSYKEIEQKPFMDGTTFRDHVRKNLKSSMEKLPDGVYYINIYHLILNKKGKVAFYDLEKRTLMRRSFKNEELDVNEKDNEDIKRAIDKVLDDLSMKPAMMNATPANYNLSDDMEFGSFGPFEIKDHKLVNL